MEKELDELKLEKKDVKYQLKLVKNCIYERLDTAIGVIDEDEPVIGSGYLYEVIDSDVKEAEYIEKVDVPVGSAPVEMELEPQVEVISDDSDVPVEDNLTAMESTDIDLSEEVYVRDNFDLKYDARATMPESYAEYSLLSGEDKVELFAISDYADSLDVMRLVKQYFQKIGHDYSIDEVMEEFDTIYEGARQISISKNAERICNKLQGEGLSYWYLTVSEKAKSFKFRMDDNHYNLALHTAVLKKLSVDMDFDERYEDYQKIYDYSMQMQRDGINGGRERRGR